jgi:hypothetical protein
VKDSKGNAIAIQYTQSTGFHTIYTLPDTGQTDNYTNTFGEDSDYTINPPSFTNNDDGTVTDNNTNLMWQSQDDGSSRSWSEAESNCSNLTLADYSDWRLPETEELQTIVDYGPISTAIDTSYFSSTSRAYYWSNTDVVSSTRAWIVSFDAGTVDNSEKSDNYKSRCVRGNSKTPSFFDNDNGTVTDKKTGMVWQKEDDGTDRTWESSLIYCEGLVLGGKSDWRLPNIKELGFIVNRKTNPAVYTTYFPENTLAYWSSTTFAEETSRSFITSFGWGQINYSPLKTDSHYARCVRSD